MLSKLHEQFLCDRAVPKDIATERGYWTATKQSELANLGFGRAQQTVPALVLPIWSVRGQIESYQLRPDTPRLSDTGRPRKYELRARTRMMLDAHPRVSRPHSGKVALIGDPAIPLLVSEGIPKTDSALALGLCTIALLGVSSFRGRNEAGGLVALADWESIAPNGRSIFIAFDSDVMEKGQVYLALVRLRAFLESQKAIVKLIYLPAGEHGGKVGLDDFVAREKTGGRSDVEVRDELLALATPELRKPAAQRAPDGNRPEIFITPGRQPGIIDAAEQALVANAAPLRVFQRAGEVVRVVRLERQIDQGGLRRPAGSIQLAGLSTLSLQEIFDRLISWKRPAADGDKPADCPARIAATYLARLEWRLPLLTGVIEAPIMRGNGSILYKAGYDEITGLYLHTEESWPATPDAPARRDAEAALLDLLEPFDQFPFVDEGRSVFTAGILTAIQRRVLGSAPLFVFDAPAQRNGKSLLAESYGIFATGRKPAAAGVARENDELRKAITAALRENQAVINLDNIIHDLDSPDLARAVTQSEYQDRLLGTNQNLRLPTNVTWTATGNNVVLRGDMPSRSLICRIDAGVERPEERVFRIVNLPSYLLLHRRRLVNDVLIILRAFHLAGRPAQNVRPLGGFDHWSREIREPLVWLGMPDPCGSRDRIIVADPDRESALGVFGCWKRLLTDSEVLTREVIQKADEDPEFKQTLLSVASTRGAPREIDARRLGRWCARMEDRIIAGMKLVRTREIDRAQMWRLVSVASVQRSQVTVPVSRDVEVANQPATIIEVELDRPAAADREPAMESPGSSANGALEVPERHQVPTTEKEPTEVTREAEEELEIGRLAAADSNEGDLFPEEPPVAPAPRADDDAAEEPFDWEKF